MKQPSIKGYIIKKFNGFFKQILAYYENVVKLQL